MRLKDIVKQWWLPAGHLSRTVSSAVPRGGEENITGLLLEMSFPVNIRVPNLVENILYEESLLKSY